MFNEIINSNRIKYVIGLLYAYVFYKGYILFLNNYFSYAGYGIIDGRIENINLMIFTTIITIIPLLFFNGVKKISSFLCIFIYFLLYVPIIITYFFNMNGEDSYVVFQQILFTIGMSLLFCADKVSTKHGFIIPSRLNTANFIFIITSVLIVTILMIYRNNLQFVSFENVYEQRFENSQYNSNFFISYSLVWLSNVFIPLSIGFGFFTKRRKFLILGITGAIVVYMGTAAKSVILLPGIMFVIYYTLKKKNLLYSFNYIGMGIIALMIVSLQFDFNVPSSLLWMRTLGNGGLLTKYYHDFFLDHPLTYYSHIKIVDIITTYYPYSKSLGEVVAAEYWGESNANANFWATDGYAAIGNFGILIPSLILFFVFTIFNKISSRYNLLFIILVLVPFITSLTNTSLFTSLVTGGSGLIFFILSLEKTRNNKNLLKSN